jgi:hypothetical protein
VGADIFEHGRAEAVRAWAVGAARGAARAVGVFASIEKCGPSSLAELAGRLEVAPRRLRAVVDLLVLDGALAWRGDRLVIGELGELGELGEMREMREMREMGGAARSGDAETVGALVEALRSDRARDAGERLAAHHAHLFSVGRPAAEALWAQLAPAGASLLDLGGGQGAYAAAWLDGAGGRVATLVDRAPVLALARAALGEPAGLRLVDGDLLDERLSAGEEHAVALLANVLHLMAPEDASRALALAARRVRAGDGLIVVKDLFVEPDRRGPEVALVFALTMALYADGTVYDVPTLRGWLEAAGLVDVRALALAAAPDSVVVVGRRP